MDRQLGDGIDALSDFNDAFGDGIDTLGDLNDALDDGIDALGDFNDASGDFNDAFGDFNDAFGDFNDAFGDFNVAFGDFIDEIGDFIHALRDVVVRFLDVIVRSATSSFVSVKRTDIIFSYHLQWMTRRNHAQVPKGTIGKCRNRRRPHGRQRLAWVRPLRRAQRALDACTALIASSVRTAAAAERSADRRPIRTSRSLHHASGRLVDASARLDRAARALAEMNECMAREPERAALAPERVMLETRRWIIAAARLQEVAGEVFALHENVLGGLASGTLVPEREPDRRPRIILAPRPAPVRAFLRVRLPRATDRIAPILRRRRRTPRPAALRVPRRSILGRAPPRSPVCPL